jgi:hypothetical protein
MERTPPLAQKGTSYLPNYNDAAHRSRFQLIPGEYSTFQLDNSNWIGNYSAKAGFVLNFYGDR